MDVAGLLLELYARLPPLAHDAVDGLTVAQLSRRPRPETNSIAWLVWHSARVQDHHVAEILGTGQIWVGDGWAAGFDLAADPANTGYGHSPRDVDAVRPRGADALTGYFDAVDARTRGMLETVTATGLDRVVDRRWDPPVTLGVRLVSIADDTLQHLGQAAFLRGLLAE